MFWAVGGGVLCLYYREEWYSNTAEKVDGGPCVAAVAEFHGCEEFLVVLPEVYVSMWVLPEVCSGLCHSGDAADEFGGEESCVKCGEEEERAFQALNVRLLQYPVLTVPTFELPMILHTNASDVGIGATLSQEDEGG